MHIFQVIKRLWFMVLIVSTSVIVSVEAGATVLIDFTGTVYEEIGSRGIGDLVLGSIEFDDTAAIDSDPDPKTGIYSILTGLSSLNVGGEEISLNNILSTIKIINNDGCDCFFLDIPLDQEIGGVHTSRFLINIQDEFGPVAFTMFGDDSLPTSTFPFPSGTYTDLQFYDSSDELIRRATIDTFSISSVPVPTTIWLFGSGLMGLIGMRKSKSKIIVLPA